MAQAMAARHTIEAWDVLAGAYVHLRTALVHAVLIDDRGEPVRVLCGRAKLDNLADKVDRPITCKTCAARAARMTSHGETQEET